MISTIKHKKIIKKRLTWGPNNVEPSFGPFVLRQVVVVSGDMANVVHIVQLAKLRKNKKNN